MTTSTQALQPLKERPAFDWRYWLQTNLLSIGSLLSLLVLLLLNAWMIRSSLEKNPGLTGLILILWLAGAVAIVAGFLRTGVVPRQLRPIRSRLYTSIHGALVSLFLLVAIALIIKALLVWVSDWERWRVITVNLRLFMVGRYPIEEIWRPWALLIMLVGLALVSLFTWGPISRVLFRLRRVVTGLWLLSPFIVLIVLRGIGPSFDSADAGLLPAVGTNFWGGLMLTIIISVIAIVASFPIGLALALGRRSDYPIIKTFSVLYIELIRGVPLLTVLFMAEFMLPLFLPGNVSVDRLVRVTTGMTIFSAAYLAENVRGGLQAIPIGQYEAAYAVGLNTFQSMRIIVLPQALRAVIPAIVGQFIALFKDTTLVAIIGLFDFLNIGRAVLGGQAEFRGFQTEVYFFVGVIYFIGSAAMSYASRRLEARLGVGQR